MNIDEIPVGKAENLTGKQFGEWTVLYRTYNTKNKSNMTVWKCKCSCGNIASVQAGHLKSGASTKCSECNKKLLPTRRFIDMTGWIMKEHGVPDSEWTVISRAPNSGHQTMWYARCSCGTESIVDGKHLRLGETKSCGCKMGDLCSNIRFKDLTGQKFNQLTALYPINKGECEGHIKWHCRCDCGNETDVDSYSLISGKQISCGCVRSKGERLISKIFKSLNISFIQEKTFDTCKNPMTNGYFRFDFWVNNEYLVEFDGIQHFKIIGWNDEESLTQRQEYDKLKNQWCKENNIPLIRIPYTKLDTLCIEDLQLETTQFRVV